MSYNEIKERLKKRPARWLVTGCAGFIGSNLTSLLKNVIARSRATKQSQKNTGNKGIAMRLSCS